MQPVHVGRDRDTCFAPLGFCLGQDFGCVVRLKDHSYGPTRAGPVERSAVVVLHSGPGFDQGYLRPGLSPLSSDAQLVFVGLARSGPIGPATRADLHDGADRQRRHAAVAPAGDHHAGRARPLCWRLRRPAICAAPSGSVGGLILCDSAPTLAPMPDDDPPPGLAQRAPAEAVEVAQRLFGGAVSPQTSTPFGRLVTAFYAAPAA